ncbi:ATP-grasp domain-containing protein [Deltaproteobacteria bacterium IMCC39524]|nr:ATP-grasp domain-containing protein [Deltaproteobacteria bacterium IMCC39524]
MKKNIFVLALDEFTSTLFGTIHHADNFQFHALLPPEKIIQSPNYAMSDLLDEARLKLANFQGSVDAIVSFWDFPATLMLPILRQSAGLPTTSIESILRCEHKYWSRLVQREVAQVIIPRVVPFNPFDEEALNQVNLSFPFWVKPVKAHSSILGFRIESSDDFYAVIPKIREGIGRFSDPFNEIFQKADTPSKIAPINGNYCIAEEIISAKNQCTLEGYVFDGKTTIYGIVDSLREENPSSFSRYHYPSRLPQDVLEQMKDVTVRVMQRTKLNNEPFNIEFFHDPETGRISLLEINPRISKSHCPLFYFVEGASHQEVMVDLGLGRKPEYPQGKGRYSMATKFMVRRYSGDAIVRRVPRRDEIEALQKDVDGVLVVVWVNEGDRLSNVADTDSYSFEYANIFIGGESEEELVGKYQQCMKRLPFEFESLTNLEL